MPTKPRVARDNGGPAFPRPASEDTSSGTIADGNGLEESQTGMSLRDYFAAQALAHQNVYFTAKVYQRGKKEPNEVQISPFEWDQDTRIKVAAWCAVDAYAQADAMLAERAK